ncbi:MAG: hypothetical protein CMO06_09535 [Thalassospira sp.]|uniref:hypothetical protein n=1 Tax=Thalassospira sp. TaxID=1912094 RepID=UPI000C36C144|nr:hypothetical protein [Thalassospira sp.]MAZ33372.1 hypothetical protein [Thalassospira sp.]
MEKVGAFTERTTALGEWRNGDPASNTRATPMLAEYFNMLQQELLSILAAAGIDPDIEDNTQLVQSILDIAGVRALEVVDLAGYLRSTVSATLAAGFWTTPVPATVTAGNVSFNTALGNRFTLTATEALTITAPDPMPAGGSARLELTMDGVGNHGIAWGPEFRVNNGAISNEPGAVNLIHMEFSGAVIDVHITQRAGA